MKMKEENEKAGLKLNIQKTKIIVSSPITSWQIYGETMETVSQSVSSVAQLCPTLCDSMNRSTPCPSLTPRVHSNSCPLSRWYHPAISSSVVPFSSCPQSLPASEAFPMSQLFAWGSQSIGVSASASVLPMNTQDWSPLEWTGYIYAYAHKSITAIKKDLFPPEVSSCPFIIAQTCYWIHTIALPDSKIHTDLHSCICIL